MMIRRRFPRWFFGWTEQFTDSWGALPAVPVLYTLMLCGTLQIIFTHRGTVTGEIHTPLWVSDIWRTSSLVSPLMVGVAWYLITHRSGRLRLFGLWLRFGGNFGQATALCVFLVIRTYYAPVYDDAHIYLMWIVGGVFAFVLMLVGRDIWVLQQVQSIAARLERLAAEGINIGEL